MTATTHQPRYSRTQVIYGNEVAAQVDSLIWIDGCGPAGGKRLLVSEDQEPIGEGWPGCDFRWPNPIAEWREKHAIACNVHVTGRTIQRKYGYNVVRVQIEWVGDCEPSQFCNGYMYVSG